MAQNSQLPNSSKCIRHGEGKRRPDSGEVSGAETGGRGRSWGSVVNKNTAVAQRASERVHRGLIQKYKAGLDEVTILKITDQIVYISYRNLYIFFLKFPLSVLVLLCTCKVKLKVFFPPRNTLCGN